MITIVKVIAVGAALSGSPAIGPENGQPVDAAGAPVIRLDHAPTQRLLPLAHVTKFASVGRRGSSTTDEGRGTDATNAAPSLEPSPANTR